MIFVLLLLIVIVGFIFSFMEYRKVTKVSEGTKEMKFISDVIYKGALSFLKTEYRVITIFVILITLFLLYFNIPLAISFLFGAVLSSFVAYVTLTVSTKSNSRTVVSASKSLKEGLSTSFKSGLSSGIFLVSIGVLSIILLYLIFQNPEILYGFGFGASLIALFLRVGGGIFTKAADVGADLVGKVETGIPEDDPRNPAVIADNVGDNVGDVAGMGSDLLESYVQSIVAAMVLGFIAFQDKGLLLPIILSSLGILSSIIGSYFVTPTKQDVYGAINKGIYASTIIVIIVSFLLIKGMFSSLDLFWSILLGLLSGVFISKYAFYVTSAKYNPTRRIAESSTTGPATNVLKGLSVGMLSTALPIIIIGITIILSYHFGGYFGIALSSVSMLSILGIILAADFYGPIVDNAQGIVEMTGADKRIQKRTEKLDELGNSTAAVTKGFAIASAAFTSIALFASYIVITNLQAIDLIKVPVIVGLLVGAMLPFIFSSFLIDAVEKAAFKIIKEVRRQFSTMKGIMTGKTKPDYDACIKISTFEAMRGMIYPALIAIFVPIIMVLLLGAEAVGGLLAGVIASGFVLALFMANTGGAWDNAKKYIEEGNLGGKGSDTHKAAVVGDTVGDPFKDTCGPSINILIKLMTVVSLILIPLIL
jgi:K(+)-stimulated pyrophosphate-energized sodium pump